MATYRCLKELEGKELHNCDTVVFTFGGRALFYTVKFAWMSCHTGNNRLILNRLELDAEQFCSEHYGYSAGEGDWPMYRNSDYAAATRVCIALFKLLEPDPIREVCDWIDKVNALIGKTK